ncbi:MAG: hypothetical protein VX278_04045 [Myxococcota bacterium]|nr:hypothetical protein [Myxococcota bacterium]
MERSAYVLECKNILSRLQTGKKVWFWFCSANVQQSLMLSELSADPTMSILAQRIQSTEAPLGVSQYVGLLSVTLDGRVEFISQKADMAMLYEISNWCKREMQNIPELAVLRNSVMVETAADGSIANRFSDPSLWKDIVGAPILGTTEHAIVTMNELATGQTAWFALSKEGNTPRLIVQPIAKDGDGENFARLIKNLGLHQVKTLTGTVLRGSKRLIFTCSKGTGEEQLFFSLLQQRYGRETGLIQTLKLFRIKETKKKEIVLDLREGTRTSETENLETPQKTADERLLSKLKDRETVLFYFSDHGEGKSPVFLVSDNKDDLKNRAKSLERGSRVLRGTVAINSKGMILFQSSKKIDGFVPALVAWIKSQSNPKAYRELFGARFIQKTAEGIISKEKNDPAWASIESILTKE